MIGIDRESSFMSSRILLRHILAAGAVVLLVLSIAPAHANWNGGGSGWHGNRGWHGGGGWHGGWGGGGGWRGGNPGWRGGAFIGVVPPVYIPPPVYYRPPPIYYPPPPAYY